MFLQIKRVATGEYIDVPKVTGLSVTSSKIVDSNVNSAGNTVHEFIGKKQTVSAGISWLEKEERDLLYDLTSQNQGLSLDIRFDDPETHVIREMNCYMGDRSIAIALAHGGDTSYWKDFSLSLMEN